MVLNKVPLQGIMDNQKFSYEFNFSTLNIHPYNCIIRKNVCHYLCNGISNVFHDGKLSWQILVGTK
jgi:hypothetical protein